MNEPVTVGTLVAFITGWAIGTIFFSWIWSKFV